MTLPTVPQFELLEKIAKHSRWWRRTLDYLYFDVEERKASAVLGRGLNLIEWSGWYWSRPLPTKSGREALATGLVLIPCHDCGDYTIEMQYGDYDEEAGELCARCGGDG